MNTKTDPAASDDPAASSAETSSPSGAGSSDAPHPVPPPNPNFALFVATVGGLGYFPKAPGTWGSLIGVILALVPSWIFFGLAAARIAIDRGNNSVFLKTSAWYADPFLFVQIVLSLLVAAVGVWASDRVSKRFREKDPQYVVIDEVS